MKPCLIILLTVVTSFAYAAVPVPGSDIWLLEFEREGEQLGLSGAPRNLTARPGYDNQPTFLSETALLFTSMDESGQTDIWRQDIATGNVAPVLRTAESEYSPTLAPDGGLSVVRVARDGVQQLWHLAPGASRYELLFPMLENIGYHAWIDHEHVALFMIRDPQGSELHVANRDTGKVMVMAKDIGRSLQPVPNASGSLGFVETGSDGKRWIKRLDFHHRKITPLAVLPGESEDFAFLPDGRMLVGAGKRLLVQTSDGWQTLGSFESLPGEISRLAVSPNGTRLALVAAENE